MMLMRLLVRIVWTRLWLLAAARRILLKKPFKESVREEVARLAVEGLDVPGLGRRYVWLVDELEDGPEAGLWGLVTCVRVHFELGESPRDAASALTARRETLSAAKRLYGFVFNSYVGRAAHRREIAEFIGMVNSFKPPTSDPEAIRDLDDPAAV